MTGRVCRDCLLPEPEVEFYSYIKWACRICHNRRMRASYYRNHERRKALGRKNSLAHYHRNRDERLAKMAEYRKTDGFKRAYKKYYENNTQKVLNKARRRRGAPGSFTDREWQRLCRRYRNACAYCGEAKKLTVDHVVPLCRGGTNFIGNILPACLRCNDSKGTRLLSEWRNLSFAVSKRRPV